MVEKILSSEEVNKNLSKVLLHLEQELSNVKKDVDVSREEQRGSEILIPQNTREEELNTLLEKKIGEYEKLLQMKES